MLMKALEMIELIMETPADLSNLNQEHVCIVYFRLLTKIGKEPDVRNNSIINGAMAEVFGLRKKKKLKGEAKFTSYAQWRVQPTVWKALAEEFALLNEPTLSVDMYDECIRLLKSTKNPTLRMEFLLDVASQYAKFQEFDTAITYAQGAWMMDRFDGRARELLAKWSEEFRWYFAAQVKGASRLQMKWRTRVWSRTYYHRYHNICVAKWEAKLKKKHFDMRTREVSE